MTAGRLLLAIVGLQQNRNFPKFPQPRAGDYCGFLLFTYFLLKPL
jgi:hypothetical protein